MCSSVTLQNGDFYFGRNMDLDSPMGERIVITPKGCPLDLRHEGRIRRKYAMIGMAPVVDGQPLYADGANEKGLCMAGQNFPGYACYGKERVEGKHNITTFEIIPWILGTCASTDEACEKLRDMNLMSTPFAPHTPPAQLHWHIADSIRSVVLEVMEDGVHVYDNPVGVMTNSPPFPYHLANLNLYLNVTAGPPENRFSSELPLKAIGMGMGGMGLPGDASPVSRFVRGAFYRMNSVCGAGERVSVTQMFHIMDGLLVVKGSSHDGQGKYAHTVYSCCMNGTKGIYYYKMYESFGIRAASLEMLAPGQEEPLVIDPAAEKDL